MITVSSLKLQFGGRVLFDDVNLKFSKGHCYGVIGANGAGKSTFLKILSGEISSTTGQVDISPGERMAVLKQNHYAYEDEQVLRAVILGHELLVKIMQEKEILYAKEEFTDADGEKAADLEGQFAELNGWQAEADAGALLAGLGIPVSLHEKSMKELTGSEKVKVLLAQALFGKPEILLLDEPTNDLDIKAISWLENFIMDQDHSIVIVVSHDRHFLNSVCTHICDIDYKKIKFYVGNYDFWYKSSQLAQRLLSEKNERAEDKVRQLKEFIQRFSANASKSKQATSRKKLLDKITLDDISPSTRKYPFVQFKPEREAGDQMLTVSQLCLDFEGERLIKNLNLVIKKNQKVVFIAPSEILTKLVFKTLALEVAPVSGKIEWGITTTRGYLPSDHSEYFKSTTLDSKDQTETYLRGFLGKMLFSGDEAVKKVNVLSGGEKVRCMLSKMMLASPNVLILENPTNHLDLETITALNEGLVEYKGTLLFTSHDHEFIQTVANRVVAFDHKGHVAFDKECTYDEYLSTL
jgi:ATPase subunit of ABC transporter with duplicated ATPase domains